MQDGFEDRKKRPILSIEDFQEILIPLVEFGLIIVFSW